jgi:hypothetical protein
MYTMRRKALEPSHHDSQSTGRLILIPWRRPTSASTCCCRRWGAGEAAIQCPMPAYLAAPGAGRQKRRQTTPSCRPKAPHAGTGPRRSMPGEGPSAARARLPGALLARAARFAAPPVPPVQTHRAGPSGPLRPALWTAGSSAGSLWRRP